MRNIASRLVEPADQSTPILFRRRVNKNTKKAPKEIIERNKNYTMGAFEHIVYMAPF